VNTPLCRRTPRVGSAGKRLDGGERLALAEQMTKDWAGRCAVCGKKLKEYAQSFVDIGHPLCWPCELRWKRGVRAPTTRSLL
jgi:hypothetical protein